MTRESASNQPDVAPTTLHTGRAPQPYLPEVQGLRTVAAMMVAVYHIWLTRVSGGVDVFFVVSAYFLTLSLLRVADQESLRAALNEAWTTFLRILRRVLPGMATVLIATIVAAYFLMPRLFFSDQWSDAVASSMFLANIQFMRQADDYLAQGLDASAFQQFWALSIQMQFYVAGIATALLAYVIARLWRRGGATARHRYAVVLASLLALIVIVTLPLGYHFTQSQPQRAYYDPTARGWEFAVGGLLALALASRRLHAPRFWPLAGWTALVALLGFAAIADVSAHFPVWAAIIPLTAASLLIFSARAGAAPANAAVMLPSVGEYQLAERRDVMQRRDQLVRLLNTSQAVPSSVPGLASVRYDLPAGYDNRYDQNTRDAEVIACDYGNTNAETTVVLPWLPEHTTDPSASLAFAGAQAADQTSARPSEDFYDDSVLDVDVPANSNLIDSSDLFCPDESFEQGGAMNYGVTIYLDCRRPTRTFTLIFSDEAEAAFAKNLPEVVT